MTSIAASAEPLIIAGGRPTDLLSDDLSNLGGQEARATFEETFPGLADQLEPTIRQSQVVADLSETAVVIDEPQGPNVLIDSTAPLVSEQSSDLIDLELTKNGGWFEPTNAVVETRLPQAADAPALIEGSGVGISFDGHSSDASTASRIADDLALFYPSVDEDTDLVAVPKTTGIELFAQLRSPDSPEALDFEVALPKDSRVVETDLGADVVSGGDVIAQVPEPSAIDANGDAVEVSMRVNGNTLHIQAPHQEGDAYPILVDPELIDNYNWPSGASFGGWTSYGDDPDYGRYAFNSYFTPGLYNQAVAGRNYFSGSVSDWYYRVPNASSAAGTTAYISDAILKDFQCDAPNGDGQRPRMAVGLWSKYERWVRLVTWNSGFNFAGNLSMATWAPLAGGTSQTESQRLDFQLYVPMDGVSANPAQSRTGRISNVEVRLTDPEVPSLQATGGGWTNGSSPIPVPTQTTDPGLGVKLASIHR